MARGARLGRSIQHPSGARCCCCIACADTGGLFFSAKRMLSSRYIYVIVYNMLSNLVNLKSQSTWDASLAAGATQQARSTSLEVRPLRPPVSTRLAVRATLGPPRGQGNDCAKATMGCLSRGGQCGWLEGATTCAPPAPRTTDDHSAARAARTHPTTSHILLRNLILTLGARVACTLCDFLPMM